MEGGGGFDVGEHVFPALLGGLEGLFGDEVGVEADSIGACAEAAVKGAD